MFLCNHTLHAHAATVFWWYICKADHWRIIGEIPNISKMAPVRNYMSDEWKGDRHMDPPKSGWLYHGALNVPQQWEQFYMSTACCWVEGTHATWSDIAMRGYRWNASVPCYHIFHLAFFGSFKATFRAWYGRKKPLLPPANTPHVSLWRGNNLTDRKLPSYFFFFVSTSH